MNSSCTVQKLFVELDALSGAIFSAKERAEIDRFVRVGEYGLALETAVDICVEEEKAPNSAFVEKVIELALALKLEPTRLIENIKAKL